MVTFRRATNIHSSINSVANDLERLKNYNDELTNLLIRFEDIESSTSSDHSPHWRESIFNFQHSQWIEALQQNNSLEQVTLNVSVKNNNETTSCWTKRHADTFVSAILSIPTLEKLTLLLPTDFLLGSSSSPSAMGSIQALTQMIPTARCLTHLELRWMRGPTTTTRTTATDTTTATATATATSTDMVSSLANAIKNCRHLQSLSIMGDQTNVDTVRSFLPVLRNTNIRKLCIGNVSSEAFSHFLDALAPPPSPLNGTTTTAIENNNNNNNRLITESLENLKVVFNNHIDDDICERLVDTLISNQSLQVLSLLQNHNNSNNNHHRRPTNQHPQQQQQQQQRDSFFMNDKGYDAIARLVENNYTLLEVNLPVHQHHYDTANKIELYTKLNRAGRRKLVYNNNDSGGGRGGGRGTRRLDDWVNVLSACEGEVDCLYHILHMNPSICEQGG